MNDDPRAVDALVKHTVRRVLFPDLRTSQPQQPTRSPVRAAIATDQKLAKDALPFAVGRHHAHVLSYASWSDAQLQDERQRLQRFLQEHPQLARHHQQQPRPEHAEQDDSTDNTEETAAALEALALLALFVRERQRDTTTTTLRQEPTRLLHAQLALYAHYFAKCHARKILHDFDVVAIQCTYQQFLDNQ